jgi:hypothetical protein
MIKSANINILIAIIIITITIVIITIVSITILIIGCLPLDSIFKLYNNPFSIILVQQWSR